MYTLRDLCMYHISLQLHSFRCTAYACPHCVKEYNRIQRRKLIVVSSKPFHSSGGAVKCAFLVLPFAAAAAAFFKSTNSEIHLCESHTTIKRFDSLHVVHYYYCYYLNGFGGERKKNGQK